MSAHDLLFPYVTPNNRDLVDAELWARSLRRSVHRREITEAARKHAMRRKSAAEGRPRAGVAAGGVYVTCPYRNKSGDSCFGELIRRGQIQGGPG